MSYRMMTSRAEIVWILAPKTMPDRRLGTK